MRKICVVTGTRAEYGLLYWTIKRLQESKELKLQLCVTGMHLSPEFGLTYKEILNDGFDIDGKVEMLMSSDSNIGISKSIGIGIIGFSELFDKIRPDIILILGDRFEIFSAATAAMISKIPIAHCHGGEATEGLIDEPIRHSITKMSHIHFTSTDEYRNRVIQLGEQPEFVFNTGALGIESINKLNLLNRNDFERSIDFKLSDLTFLVTYHPVTLENSTAKSQMESLLKALNYFPNCGVIFTMPNADNDGRVIIELINEYVIANPKRAKAFKSLGQLRYLSAIKHCDIIIGNSSSGLIEVPSFKKPTINIGDRQRGRIKAESVIDTIPETNNIVDAIKYSLSSKFITVLKNVKNPYGENNSSELIVEILNRVNINSIVKKHFYNIK